MMLEDLAFDVHTSGFAHDAGRHSNACAGAEPDTGCATGKATKMHKRRVESRESAILKLSQ
jgi:hypothetical protein